MTSSDLCAVCGAGLRPGGECRFEVPEEEAPWLAEFRSGGGTGRDRELRLQVARWLLHHPDRADAADRRWAARIAGVSVD